MVLLVAVAGTAIAQGPASIPSTLAGTWERHGSTTEARRTVLAAFEPRIRTFPEIMWGVARERISESLPTAERIEITTSAQRVRVVTHASGRRVVVDTALGGSTRVRLEDGDERRVVQRLRGGWLEQVFDNDDGSIQRLLSTEADGQTLHVDYTVHNTTLGAPVRWRMDYGR